MKTAFAPPARMTAAEYAALPPEAPLGQLIEGTYFMAPAPRSRHQLFVQRLHLKLARWAQRSKWGQVWLSPLDVFLDDDTVVQPDLLLLRRDQAHRMHDDGLHGPPDLAIEVISESTRRLDLFEKASLYEKAGVGEYWLVDGEKQQMLVYYRSPNGWETPAVFKGRELLVSRLLPGLRLRMSTVFASP